MLIQKGGLQVRVDCLFVIIKFSDRRGKKRKHPTFVALSQKD